MPEFSVVGKPLPRIDSPAKAVGEAQYVDDIVLPRMLYGKILRSSLPHARVLNVDTSRAERLVGVKAVVTGKDIPDRTYGIVPMAHDEHALAEYKVRFIGNDVAAVAAIDEDTAEEALSLIKVDYEPLPAVCDISGAIIKIQQDGSVTLLTGAADIGQGAESVLAQIAAEVLGVRLEDIRVTAADTELTPLDPGTFGSGVTFRAGNAAKLAAVDARRQIAEVVGEKLEASPDDLVFQDRRVLVKGSPEKGLSWTQALKTVQYADRDMPVVGHGFYHADCVEPTTLLAEDGNLSPAYSFMAQTAEDKSRRGC